MPIFHGEPELIGNTPLLRLHRCEEKWGLQAVLLAKLENMNPTGSAKDRAALHMINAAEESGALRPGGTIVEPTSGNTGIALAAIAAARGYRVLLTMPETMSAERQMLLRAYGAELVLTEGKYGMNGAVEKALALAESIENAFIPSQFDNPANAQAHYCSTGPEIWRDCGGCVDALVAGVGSGGTISGTGKFLREHNPALYIAAVEPESSPVLRGGSPAPHGLQGIGANFVPAILDRSLLDEVIGVAEEDAYCAARSLLQWEGIFAGISSGAALHAAMLLARRPEMQGKTIVTILPDSGDRYLSTPLYAK